MLSALGASADRWIANAIVARARRRWLPLRLLPAIWIRPLAKPVATGIRRRLSRTAARIALISFLITVLLVRGL
jgi:hypothetical protein